MKVGLFYNLRKDWSLSSINPIDLNADWDVIDTIERIKEGLVSNNFEVLDLKDPVLLFDEKIREKIDIVFSICEMQGFRYRESIVSTICELLHIPYVFSTPDTLMISLDKNICNFLVKQAGCNLPNWFYIKSVDDIDNVMFQKYPYILKPSAEGSGIGINSKSVVYNFSELQFQLKNLFSLYKQPILIQEYIIGREITIGVIEKNGILETFTPLELKPKTAEDFIVYGFNEKENADNLFEFIPLIDDKNLIIEINKLATNVFKSINCRDAARIDIRISKDNVPYFIEINPLPHLHPDIGDFCRSAKASNISYSVLLKNIMENAMKRFNLKL